MTTPQALDIGKVRSSAGAGLLAIRWLAFVSHAVRRVLNADREQTRSYKAQKNRP